MIRDEVMPDDADRRGFESTDLDVAIGDYNISGDA